MCLPGQPAEPSSAADAVAMARAALAWLAAEDVASLPAGAKAECLRELERIASVHTAARASVLQSFTSQAGYEADGQGSARTWLKWQCQMTGRAAAGAVGWMRRLTAHPTVQEALAAAQVSESFAQAICGWTEKLPEHLRADADAILLAAAADGAELADLAALAEQILRRTAGPDRDNDDGFEDRWVRLEETFRGAGSLSGELTPRCRAAVRAVLDSLGKRHGPEDTRSKAQREHDALEEAMRRLLASGCLPGRAGQPTQLHLSLTLDQLRNQPGAADAEADWTAATATGAGLAGPWPAAGAGPDGPWPAAAPGDACDATIVPIVTGHIDPAVLDQLAIALLEGRNRAAAGSGGAARARPAGTGADVPPERAISAARQLLLARAADLLSGPGGLASWLRTRLPEQLAYSVSLPLDIGAAAETIPAHLRRAVTARDRKCRFPGCDQPAAASQVHHIVHRADGGPTRLDHLLTLCTFHHLIVIHRWGWGIRLNPDGTVTATSPDGSRVLRSHALPSTAA